jgi:hypothetical protein
MMAFVTLVLLIMNAWAEEESEYPKYLETEAQGYLYTSHASISGIGLTNVYCNSNGINDDGERVLSLKALRSGSGAYNHSSSEMGQSSVELGEEGYESSDWKMKKTEHASAAQAEIILNIPGSFKSKPINLPWKDLTLSANYPGLVFTNYRFNYAKAFDKEIAIDMHSDIEDIDEYNMPIDEYDEPTYLTVGNAINFKASFDGIGHIGMISNKSIVSEDYMGSFALSNELAADSMKRVDIGDYENDFSDYLWLPCCIGGYFNMSRSDQKYISLEFFCELLYHIRRNGQ